MFWWYKMIKCSFPCYTCMNFFFLLCLIWKLTLLKIILNQRWPFSKFCSPIEKWQSFKVFVSLLLQYCHRSSNCITVFSGTLARDLWRIPLQIRAHDVWLIDAIVISIDWNDINGTLNILARCTKIPFLQRYRYDVTDTPVAAKAVRRARAVVIRVIHRTTDARSFLRCDTWFRYDREPRSHTPPSNSALTIWRTRHPRSQSGILGAWGKARSRKRRYWWRAP